MLNSLADAVLERVKQKLSLNAHTEGVTESGWVLIDYGNVVIHLFSPDQREYYQLEQLWSKGKVLLSLK
jgi:ribosome-associated protein